MRPEKVLNWAFGILFFAVPFFFFPRNFELFEFNKMMAVYALTVIIVGVWVWRMVSEGRIIFRRTFLDIPLLLFLLSQFLSFVFSIDRHVSLWGYYSRFNGGLLSLVSYALLYWAYVSNFSSKLKAQSSKPNLKAQNQEEFSSPHETILHLKLLLASAAIVSIYAVLEHVGVSPSCVLIYRQFNDACWVQDVKTRVFATLGQPNWLAAWVVAIAPLAWAMALKEKIKDKNEKIDRKIKKLGMWVGLSALLILTTIYTKSRSGFLGFVAADLVFWGVLGISLIRHISQVRTGEIVRSFLVFNFSFLILAAASGTPWTPSVGDILRPKQPAAQVAQAEPALEGGGTETGAIRKIVWQGAVKIGLAHPLFGTGVETFSQSYYQFRPVEHNNVSEWDFLYNKAHNEFLNYFATTGFFGLGSYLLLIGAFVFWGVREVWGVRAKDQKPETKYLTISLLAGYLSIPVTNFFGFSVVTVQLLLFLLPAMAVVTVSGGKLVRLDKFDQLVRRFSRPIFWGVALASLLLLLQLTRMWVADTHYAKANQLSQAGNAQQAFGEARGAVELNGGEPVFHDLLAQVSASLAVLAQKQNEATIASELAAVAMSESDKAISTSPGHLQFWNSRTRIFYSLAEAEPTKETELLNFALAAITRSTKLAPTHPKTFYNLGLVQLRLGQVKEAKESLTKAINLKPDYKDPRYALALLAAGEKNYKEAVGQAEYILANIDPKDAELRALVASWSAVPKKSRR